MSPRAQTSFARRILKDQLKPIEKIRYDIARMDSGKFNLTESDSGVKTLCTLVKEEEPEEGAEAEAVVEEEKPEDTRSALYN